jgi:hypothetical protein
LAQQRLVGQAVVAALTWHKLAVRMQTLLQTLLRRYVRLCWTQDKQQNISSFRE